MTRIVPEIEKKGKNLYNKNMNIGIINRLILSRVLQHLPKTILKLNFLKVKIKMVI